VVEGVAVNAAQPQADSGRAEASRPREAQRMRGIAEHAENVRDRQNTKSKNSSPIADW
jgi:hypothetical protein